MNIRIGKISKVLTPGYGWCYRCETTWAFVDGHLTDVPSGRWGAFPLCEKCWQGLGTPEARWPYYEQLLASWAAWDRAYAAERRGPLREAVFAGS